MNKSTMLSIWLHVFIWMLVNEFPLVEVSALKSLNLNTSPLNPSTIQPYAAALSIQSSSAASLTSIALSNVSSFLSSSSPSLSPSPPSSSPPSSSPPSSSSLSRTTSPSLSSSSTPPSPSCPDDIRGITIAVMHSPPYVFQNTNGHAKDNQGSIRGIIVECLIFSFKMCHHSCPSPLNITWKVVNTSNELVQEITSGQSDIILPITSRLLNSLSWPDYTGTPFSFNSIVKTSSRALIINKNHFNQKSMQLMLQALLDTWPIFVYTLILAGLSGVCIWILESRGNSDEFQRTFLKGWWEGFWWAFVSMTTVGYGDKTPKSILGRVVGVIWILVGIVIVAMFTATATNALTLINSGIENKKLAVLSSTGASIDAINKGARPIEYGSFQEMYEALESQQVEGIFIDQYVGAHYMKEISDENLRVLTVIDTEINYILAANANTYKELTKNACVLEALGHSSCDRLLQKYSLPIKSFSFNEDYKGLLSSSSEDTVILMYTLLIILCAGLGIGFGIELIIYRCPQLISHLCRSNKQHPSESAAEMKAWSTGASYHDASFGTGKQDEINQLTNTNARLKELGDEIESLRNKISLVVELKQMEGFVEQSEMSHGVP